MHGWTLMWRPNLGPLRKSVKYNNIILKGGDLLACECWGLATASQKAASKTTNTKATALCEQIYMIQDLSKLRYLGIDTVPSPQ
jgi:hypothetical protein